MTRCRPCQDYSQRGITGLETAIVLIAFVMVASVFAYVVLSAGLYSSQRAKEAIYAGLEETRGSVDLRGNVLAGMSGNTTTHIYFYIAQVSGGEAVDFTDTSEGNNKVAISYHDSQQHIESVEWLLTKVTTENDDNLLDRNEIFLITVDLENTDNISLPGPYDTFNLEVKPPTGAVLVIQRMIPARESPIVNLY